jgi:Rod binding domain-containing protein
MAIEPPSDIVLDVARAADPARVAAVQERLGAAQAAAAASASDFSAALQSAENAVSASARGASAPSASNMRARLADSALAGSQRAHKAEVQFESVMLSSFIGEMLPKDAPDAFGKGMAGDMWRSMLAEKIADQLAGAGALGIGRRLFATHPLSASTALGEPARVGGAAHAATTQSSANILSAPFDAQNEGGSVMFSRTRSL